MFPFRAGGLSFSLDVLHEGTGINILQFWTKNWEHFQLQDDKLFGTRIPLWSKTLAIILVLCFLINRVGNFTSGIENGGRDGQLGLEVRVFVLQGLEKFSNFVNFVFWCTDTPFSPLGLKLYINLLLIEKQCIKITKLQRFILYFRIRFHDLKKCRYEFGSQQSHKI
jgi:hypothetical protein